MKYIKLFEDDSYDFLKDEILSVLTPRLDAVINKYGGWELIEFKADESHNRGFYSEFIIRISLPEQEVKPIDKNKIFRKTLDIDHSALTKYMKKLKDELYLFTKHEFFRAIDIDDCFSDSDNDPYEYEFTCWHRPDLTREVGLGLWNQKLMDEE